MSDFGVKDGPAIRVFVDGDELTDTKTATEAIQASIGARDDIAATTDTGTFSLIALIKRLFSKLPATLGVKTAANSLSVTPASDAIHVAVPPTQVTAIQSFNRPGDVTPYSANDSVNSSTSAPTYLTFANMARANGGSGIITGGSVMHELVSVTPRIRLHLFNTAPTPVNDNAALALTYATVIGASYLGYIDFPAMSTDGGSDFSRAQRRDEGKIFDYKCDAASTSLFGVLQTLDGFTPGNAKGWTVKLTGYPD